MSYIVLNPDASVNRTGKYLVVPYAAWLAVADGVVSELPTDRQYDTYRDAEREANQLNDPPKTTTED